MPQVRSIVVQYFPRNPISVENRKLFELKIILTLTQHVIIFVFIVWIWIRMV
jgi:hypothetical protein